MMHPYEPRAKHDMLQATSSELPIDHRVEYIGYREDFLGKSGYVVVSKTTHALVWFDGAVLACAWCELVPVRE